MKLPEDIANEWHRFLDTKPTIAEQSDWMQLKAAEHGWNFYDLSLALSFVRKPEIRHDDEDDEPEVN